MTARDLYEMIIDKKEYCDKINILIDGKEVNGISFKKCLTINLHSE